jgi:hypothetical protein
MSITQKEQIQQFLASFDSGYKKGFLFFVKNNIIGSGTGYKNNSKVKKISE